MIVEYADLHLGAGRHRPVLRLYREKGLAVQKRILGHLVGYYAVEVGELNKVVHLWAYDSLDERAERRAGCGPMRNGWPTWPRSARWWSTRRTRS